MSGFSFSPHDQTFSYDGQCFLTRHETRDAFCESEFFKTYGLRQGMPDFGTLETEWAILKLPSAIGNQDLYLKVKFLRGNVIGATLDFSISRYEHQRLSPRKYLTLFQSCCEQSFKMTGQRGKMLYHIQTDTCEASGVIDEYWNLFRGSIIWH